MSIFESRWVKSGAYSIGSRLSILFFGFGAFYFLVRLLPKESFGVWSIFLTITTIVEMSRNGLIQNALIKLLHSSDQFSANKVITASWVINLIYSGIMYLLLLLMSSSLNRIFGVDELHSMFAYFGITIILLVPISQLNYLQQARFSFSGIFWTAFVRQGLFFSVIAFFFFLNHQPSLTTLVLIQAGCTLISLFVAFFSARQFFMFSIDWDKKTALRVFDFGKFVMGTNICSLLFKSVDQFSVGYFLNATSVAIYSSAIRLTNMIEYPATSVAEVIYPYSTSKINEEGQNVTKAIYEKSVGLTLIITLPIVVLTFLFADLIILIIAGSAYEDAVDVLRITALIGIVTPFNRQFGMAMDSSGRPHLNFLLLVFALFINVVNNAIFIHFFGLVGAGYGTLLSYVIISVAGHMILVRIFQVKLSNIYHYMIMYYIQSFSFVKNILIMKK